MARVGETKWMENGSFWPCSKFILQAICSRNSEGASSQRSGSLDLYFWPDAFNSPLAATKIHPAKPAFLDSHVRFSVDARYVLGLHKLH